MSKTTQEEETGKIRPIEEFENAKKELDNLMIYGLLQYVKNGTILKVNNQIHMTCFNIIYNFTYYG